MREFVKDVAARLAGKSRKAIRQLEMTYGGSKRHTAERMRSESRREI